MYVFTYQKKIINVIFNRKKCWKLERKKNYLYYKTKLMLIRLRVIEKKTSMNIVILGYKMNKKRNMVIMN